MIKKSRPKGKRKLLTPVNGGSGIISSRKNPLKLDPSRTSGIRLRLQALLKQRYARLKLHLSQLVADQDVFGLEEGSHTPEGLTHNTVDWKYDTSEGKIKRFRAWLREQMGSTLSGNDLIQSYINQSYKKGATRSYDDATRNNRVRDIATAGGNRGVDFHGGAKEQFLNTLFSRKPTVEKVKLLASRTFTELEDVDARMGTKMSRILADGLARGMTPKQMAKAMVKEVDLELPRALLIARTEVVRAHAEGQLDALEEMGGGDGVGVKAVVEWNTAEDEGVCPLCEVLEGNVFTVKDARGLIPRHANCRCAWELSTEAPLVHNECATIEEGVEESCVTEDTPDTPDRIELQFVTEVDDDATNDGDDETERCFVGNGGNASVTDGAPAVVNDQGSVTETSIVGPAGGLKPMIEMDLLSEWREVDWNTGAGGTLQPRQKVPYSTNSVQGGVTVEDDGLVGAEADVKPMDNVPPSLTVIPEQHPVNDTLGGEDGWQEIVFNDNNCGTGSGGFQPGNTCAKGDVSSPKAKLFGAGASAGRGGIGSLSSMLGLSKGLQQKDVAKVESASGEIGKRIEQDTHTQKVRANVLQAGERINLWTKEVERTQDVYSAVVGQHHAGTATLQQVQQAVLEHEAAKSNLAKWTEKDTPAIHAVLAAPNPIQASFTSIKSGSFGNPLKSIEKITEEGTGFVGRVVGHKAGESGLHFAPKLQRWPLERSECGDNPTDVRSPFLRISDRVSDPSIVVHEAGHGLEMMLPGALRACKQFLAYRCGTESPTFLKEQFPDRGFSADETGRKDQFERVFGTGSQRAYYVGKDYGEKGSEVLSMGIEQLHRDPLHFAKADPEYFKFVVGVLHGTLR